MGRHAGALTVPPVRSSLEPALLLPALVALVTIAVRTDSVWDRALALLASAAASVVLVDWLLSRWARRRPPTALSVRPDPAPATRAPSARSVLPALLQTALLAVLLWQRARTGTDPVLRGAYLLLVTPAIGIGVRFVIEHLRRRSRIESSQDD